MRALALGLVVLALAGCSGAPEAPLAADAAPIHSPPAFSDSTGAIDGRVVNDESLPAAGALVVLQPIEASAITDAQGRFSFGLLNPGDYTLTVNASGYGALERAVIVVPGEILELVLALEPRPALEPYTSTAIFNGRTTCSVSYRSPANFLRPTCATAVMTDKWNIQSRLDPGFHELLIETTWRPTYSYGDQMLQIVRIQPYTQPTNIQELEGPPPIRIMVPRADWQAWDQAHGTNYTVAGGDLSLSTFAAHNLVGDPSPVQLGILIDQSFVVFATSSYNGPLPPDHTALHDE